jgi:tripartite-type tricarboxylate transporter receptor subunit TctC
LASGSLASAHALSASLPYSTLDDFTPVISLGLQPLALVTGPTTGIKTLNELIVRARAKSGAMNFASAGVGSATHLAAERFRISAGFDAQHIPFRGPTEALTEIMAGRVDFFVAPTPSALSLIKEGKVIALAGSGTKRAAVLPDVPTTTELGLVDSTYLLYSGLFSPAKTNRGIVSRIHQEMAKALQVPSVQDKLQTLGVEPMPMSQEQFEKYFRDEVEANVKLVKVANIPLQK